MAKRSHSNNPNALGKMMAASNPSAEASSPSPMQTACVDNNAWSWVADGSKDVEANRELVTIVSASEVNVVDDCVTVVGNELVYVVSWPAAGGILEVGVGIVGGIYEFEFAPGED
jgi:hypothetical protein